MSFWSWIGLADRSEISALQSEIDYLNKKNKEYQEQNCKLFEDILKKLCENSKTSADEKDRILSEMAKCTDKIEQLLSRLQEQMNESQKCIQKNGSRITEQEERMDDLIVVSKQIEEKTHNLDEVQEQLVTLAESVKYLWSVMKAVWVDSVLSEVDSLK